MRDPRRQPCRRPGSPVGVRSGGGTLDVAGYDKTILARAPGFQKSNRRPCRREDRGRTTRVDGMLRKERLAMIALLDMTQLKIPTLSLPPQEPTGSADAPRQDTACHHCDAYRPAPQLSGNLLVNPEIHLPSPGQNLDIAYYYNSATLVGTPLINGPYGYMRTLSPLAVAQLYNGGDSLIIERGNGAIVSFLSNGSGTFLPQTPGVLSTVTEDTVDGLLLETTPAGHDHCLSAQSPGLPQQHQLCPGCRGQSSDLRVCERLAPEYSRPGGSVRQLQLHRRSAHRH